MNSIPKIAILVFFDLLDPNFFGAKRQLGMKNWFLCEKYVWNEEVIFVYN